MMLIRKPRHSAVVAAETWHNNVNHGWLRLLGRCRRLRGLDERLRQETNLPVNVIDDPLTCVARGALKIIENLDAYKPVLLNTHRKSR